jgi:hypothetical protein
MATFSGRVSVALAALTLAGSSLALADTPSGRAVIRGTGSEVRIVYESRKAAPTEVRASLAEDPLAEALRRKSAGENDASIIAFLRMNQAHLPEVIDSEIVQDFRRAGAGEDVVSILSSFSAVDIGETAEGWPVQELPPPQGAYQGAYPDLVGMGYPFYGGGYFAGGDFGFGGGHFGPKLGMHGPRGRRKAGLGFHPRKPSFLNRHASSSRPQRTRAALPAPRPRGFAR